MTPEEFEFEYITSVQYTQLREGRPFIGPPGTTSWQEDALSILEKSAQKALERQKKEEQKVVIVDPEEVLPRFE